MMFHLAAEQDNVRKPWRRLESLERGLPWLRSKIVLWRLSWLFACLERRTARLGQRTGRAIPPAGMTLHARLPLHA